MEHTWQVLGNILTTTKGYLLIALYLLVSAACSEKAQQNLLSAGSTDRIPSNTHYVFNPKNAEPEHRLVLIEWTQTGGIPVILNNQHNLNASFVSPQVFAPETLTFQLKTISMDQTESISAITIDVYPVVDLSNAEFAFSELPSLNNPFILSLTNTTSFGFLRWSLTLNGKPIDAFTLSENRKQLYFTATEIGTYTVIVRSDLSDTQRTITFTITEDFPFQQEKLKGVDQYADIETLIGIIANQHWVRSNVLSSDAIENIVRQHPYLVPVGFDIVKGLLVEYDETNEEALAALSSLAATEGITQVIPRLYEGKKAAKIESQRFETDDYADWSSIPSGDNWHLEKIEATDAWQYSTGHPDILIGISDAGFESQHSELQGRVSEEHIHTQDQALMDHGNGVAGTIAAIANNNQGIAGINWQSQIVLAGNDYKSLLALTKNPAIKVITSSWAIPGYIPKDFDLTNHQSTTNRKQKALQATRQYRTLAAKHPDKLFIWSSGNGINNGKGYKDIYGIPGHYHSPALHLADNGDIAFQDNVLFVGALSQQDELYYYSNYGNLVEIASPSHFQSLTATDYKPFLGTSAAAPVVAGVASLIYALNPDFKGSDVKSILLDSATSQVNERSVSPTGNQTESIQPTAILNASSAIKETQIRLSKRLYEALVMRDAEQANLQLSFTPFKEGNQISNLSGTVTQGIETRDFISDTHTATVDLPKTQGHFTYTASVNISGSAIEELTLDFTSRFSVSQLNLQLIDGLSLEQVSGFSLTLENLKEERLQRISKPSDSQVSLYLLPGQYKLYINALGYHPYSQLISISEPSTLPLTVNLTPLEEQYLANLNGFVTDNNGNPLKDVTLLITTANNLPGTMQAITTDSKGFYQFRPIPMLDENERPFSNFNLFILKEGFQTQKNSVSLSKGTSRTVNLTLGTAEFFDDRPFYDDAEQRTPWHYTGLWQRINLNANDVFNQLADRGFSALPNDLKGKTANLPKAYNGDFAYWYGSTDTGSYVGNQSNKDTALSGGTSTTAHSGALTSLPISLQGTVHPVLSFQTFWEVEQQAVGQNSKDHMSILISADGGKSFQPLKSLNPETPPSDSLSHENSRSNRGVSLEPTWEKVAVDLNAYQDQLVMIKFLFETQDNLRNGFRGWLIDNIEINDIAIDTQETSP